MAKQIHIDELPQRCRRVAKRMNKKDGLYPAAFKDKKGKWEIEGLTEEDFFSSKDIWSSKNYYRIVYD